MYSKEEKKQLNLEFWNEFALYCRSNSYFTRQKKNWLLNKTGVNNVHLKFDISRNCLQVVLEVMHRNENRRLEVYALIEKYKVVIEDGFDVELMWDFAYRRDNGQEVCRIYIQMDNVDFHKKTEWPVYFEFMAQNMLKLETNFLELRDLIKK